ncbi:hypothetical protein KIN20_006697 [Parelaphostrongylus tenuis]|uniref:Uncharacterized protein n=1 Tax=Parelaphostrongylus tenuis TaxID=148309 RepID=A0AAD5MKI0_PARTN|nr:hypothetical protein KIN20_006697 [Parelaphostrongylus tenuis]
MNILASKRLALLGSTQHVTAIQLSRPLANMKRLSQIVVVGCRYNDLIESTIYNSYVKRHEEQMTQFTKA